MATMMSQPKVRALPAEITAVAERQAFADPDRFDPSRSTSRMITFGYGIHHCLGANLARMECGVLLTRVRRTLPGLTLSEPPAMRPSMSLRGFQRFPVALEAPSR
jgi:cytochrome P450